MAENKGKICNAFTGGGEHALDAITDHQAGYWSFVLDDSSKLFVPFSYVSEDLTEDLIARPRIVRPDDNPSGSGVWKEFLIDWSQLDGRPDEYPVPNPSDVYIYTTDTINQANAKIAALPRYIGKDQTQNIYFEDGAHDYFSVHFLFSGFYGPGTLNVAGESGDQSLRTSQATILDAITPAVNTHILYFINCHCSIRVTDFHFKIYGSSLNALYINSCTGPFAVQGNYFEGRSTSHSYGIRPYWTPMLYVWNNYFSNMWAGFEVASLARVTSYNNSSTGTNPYFPFRVNSGGIIHKNGTTQPSGGADVVQGGGIIVQPSGASLGT